MKNSHVPTDSAALVDFLRNPTAGTPSDNRETFREARSSRIAIREFREEREGGKRTSKYEIARLVRMLRS